jgi:hypothetical protein
VIRWNNEKKNYTVFCHYCNKEYETNGDIHIDKITDHMKARGWNYIEVEGKPFKNKMLFNMVYVCPDCNSDREIVASRFACLEFN